MKFLVLQYFKDSFFALPQEKQAEIITGSYAFADKFLKDGGCKMAYVFADLKGNAYIWDVQSSEDWMSMASECPLAPYVQMERIPVVDYETANKFMKQSMAAAQRRASQSSSHE